ncbi:MsnO8 family LLM class oxidoreductase [Paenibacillus sp. CN-4]|uniref:MsnO8 family LLM class oxidoreductase n=1 Tax=Paenibacillus nanchangensis TaxID=3348343 RepID=UPI00397A3EAF
MNKLQLGVLDLAPRPSGTTAEAALQEAVRLAQDAESWGYERYWVAEHHDISRLSCPSPEVLLGYIGAVTASIRLGSGALLLPHYSPLKVAESFHLLSALCPGRIELGIGRAPGGPPHAAMALSGNYLQHVAELPGALDALTQLLEDAYAYEGTPVTARPLPEHPPALWLLGTNTRSAEYAARFGAGYVFGEYMSDKEGADVIAGYRRAFQPSSRLSEAEAMVAVAVVCAPTGEEARRLAADSAFPGSGPQTAADAGQSSGSASPQAAAGTGGSPGGTGPQTAADAGQSSGSASPQAAAGAAETGAGESTGSTTPRAAADAAAVRGTGQDKAASAAPVLAGDPEEVLAGLRDRQERYGTGRFLIYTPAGDYEQRRRSYRLLAEAAGFEGRAGKKGTEWTE